MQDFFNRNWTFFLAQSLVRWLWSMYKCNTNPFVNDCLCGSEKVFLFWCCCLGLELYRKSYKVMVIYDVKPAELLQAHNSRPRHVWGQLITHLLSSPDYLFLLIVILNQPRPPSQQCCSNCHTALLLYIAAAAVHAQCLSPATHACWPAAGLSFCNPITSAATTGRFCFYGPLQRSAAIHPCYVCQAHHFQGKNKSRRSLMPNFPLNCFSACCNYT